MFTGCHIGPTYDFVDFFSRILLRQASKPDAQIQIAFADVSVRDENAYAQFPHMICAHNFLALLNCALHEYTKSFERWVGNSKIKPLSKTSKQVTISLFLCSPYSQGRLVHDIPSEQQFSSFVTKYTTMSSSTYTITQ